MQSGRTFSGASGSALGGYRVPVTSTANFTVSSAGAAVTLSFATVDAYSYVPGILQCGYDAAPAAGSSVYITDYAGTTTYWAMPLTAAGPAEFNLADMKLPTGKGIKASMEAGGGSILAYLSIRPFLEQ